MDPTKPRLQPERPTHVDLPQYSILTKHDPVDWADESARPDFRRLCTQVKRLSDINLHLIRDFNFQIQLPTATQTIVPRDKYGDSYLPPLHRPQDNKHIAVSTLSHQTEFDARHNELKLDNDIVYRIVCRERLPDGIVRVRLTSFRNFFSALENMSEHWETDLDHYFIAGEDNYQDDDLPEARDNDISEAQSLQGPIIARKPSMFSGFGKNGKSFTFSADRNAPMASTTAETLPISPTTLSGVLQQSNGEFPFRSPPIRTSSMDSMGSSSSSEADIPIPMYRGRRISSGVKMPGLYRTETVKGFLEAAVFDFGCRLSLPRAPAYLTISGVRVPLRHQTFLVHRVPTDRDVAQLGFREGPVMGSFVRQDIEAFSAGDSEAQTDRLRLDVFREMGCLLHLAQERRRDGQHEQFWVKPVPQGGHWFSEMASDGSKPEDSPSEFRTEEEKAAIEADRRRKKVKTKYDMWKDMLPQRSLWDPKVKYTAIGKDDDSDWDEVSIPVLMYNLHTDMDCLYRSICSPACIIMSLSSSSAFTAHI